MFLSLSSLPYESLSTRSYPVIPVAVAVTVATGGRRERHVPRRSEIIASASRRLEIVGFHEAPPISIVSPIDPPADLNYFLRLAHRSRRFHRPSRWLLSPIHWKHTDSSPDFDDLRESCFLTASPSSLVAVTSPVTQ
ncbi:hypothetical protein TIFTF001_016608 [Ficus carica]|uniref:Uncharacterized protein n=1 Tax=Ficus carica TaxID=3494 RepID=A0AA88D8X1_FICCA|nr:hypothetical protein TIFTF001_016608 [Ficus carica]